MSLFPKKAVSDLQVCVIAEDGDVVAQLEDYCVLLTIRNPEREEKATIRMTACQAQMLAEVFERIPDREEEFE